MADNRNNFYADRDDRWAPRNEWSSHDNQQFESNRYQGYGEDCESEGGRPYQQERNYDNRPDRHRPRRRRSRSRSRSRERDRGNFSSSGRSRDRGNERDRRRYRDEDNRIREFSGDADRSESGFYNSSNDTGGGMYGGSSSRSTSGSSNYDEGGMYGGGTGNRSGSNVGYSRNDDGRRSERHDSGPRHNRDSEHDDDNGGNKRINGRDWKDKLTSIREAHFNRSKQPPSVAQNQFRNDGSFMEMFKLKMQQSSQGEDQSNVTPNSLVLASKSIPFSPELSLPPLTTTPTEEVTASSSTATESEDVDGTPIQKPIRMPVSMGKRRLAKPLKTGIVLKKPQKSEEAEGSQEKLDAWARYLQEVQKYKSAKCLDEDASRPLVK
ncbi:pre-mRNA-splicing factor CWC25 [Aplysia californica]|uniref:Pre-mRNA-splicing factor CWC25 n=1 Tax=Aplysia californica TaxID=6500 RepID=A0ABM0K2A6_APLCA|nr:pre-mRNA-splicing factor CWC25 [Aplysia californica]